MKFEVKNRFSGEVQFMAEIEADEKASTSINLGLAVKWAYKTGANLRGAYLRDANLRDADLRGAYLRDANLGNANLRGAYLMGAYLRDANLGNANLGNADLRGAYLRDANLVGANLRGANLRGAYLRDADLGNALKIDLDDIPVVPNIDIEILSAIDAGGTLDMDSWHGPENHWCGTTHCRAGWAIHIAGEKGKALQDKYGAQIAGTLIYEASRPGIPAPWFFDSTKNALEDLRKCARGDFITTDGTKE